MTYGIDLGTTNSLLACYDTNYISELIPSCVDRETGEAGVTQFENMKAIRSYKTDMSMGVEGNEPRYASKCVLKEVARQQPGVKDVVISVPAYFSDSQREATKQAAQLAGLNVRALVNEPTAAAMYIAQDKLDLFVVFDLGGGTFDCTIIDSRFGMFDVQATDGLTIGGDNFDMNIARNFILEGHIPIHKMTKDDMTALKHFASKQKIRMQKEQAEFAVDLSQYGGQNIIFKPDTYIGLMQKTFSPALNCLKKLVSEWVPDEDSCEILLVGGSTRCPYLKKWIEDTLKRPIAEQNYDPDKVVAQGAALYGKLVDNGEIFYKVSDVTKQLSIGQYDGTCAVIVPENSKIPLTVEKMFTNPKEADSLNLELYQGNNVFKKDNDMIGSLIWEYSETKKPNMGQVKVTINIDSNGIITFTANELLREPKTIILKRQNLLSRVEENNG